MVSTDETSSRISRVARALTRAPVVMWRHLWVWPVLGALVLGGVGLWVRHRLESSTRAELASRLQTLLNADVAALRLWFSEKESDAQSFAADLRIQGAAVELAALAEDSNAASAVLLNSAPAKTLQANLTPMLEAQHYIDYVVVGADRRILASPHRYLVGRLSPPNYELFLRRALTGKLAVSRPFAREATLSQRAEGPTMFVAAPFKTPDGKVIAVLGLRMKPEAEFSQILSVARMGQTGESYAFDRLGVMLTASRFDPELKTMGLIPNSPEATAILNLRLFEPGPESKPRSVATNSSPAARLEPIVEKGPRNKAKEPHLSRPAAEATSGRDGVDVEGYRNYRGVNVVGAWAWVTEYGLGVATEVATEEAFATLYLLRQAFMVLFVLLVLSAVAIFAFTLLVERLQANLRRSALTARRLGQYVLVQEIGRGSNGMVYRARHRFLRRPVAIKLLSPDITNEANAARFEHEVQMTSQLTHPNTVAIYDYGRTPEGLFYYAMEYLGGIDLDQLVRQFGPQPEGRIIHILRQICGSLAEAHRIGLIHRDIKPANIVLTRRGGLCDVVKVLDFGLVQAVNGAAETKRAKTIEGTPHFMPPEAIQNPESVDGRSDIYSLGAVGYWLLTGKTLFETSDVEALLAMQVKEMPLPPSERLGRACSADLEAVLMQCLAKNPEDRPPTAELLDEALSRCVSEGTWTLPEAEQWWRTSVVNVEPASVATMPEKTLVIEPRE
jgi:hypothetical protein